MEWILVVGGMAMAEYSGAAFAAKAACAKGAWAIFIKWGVSAHCVLHVAI